MSWTVHEDEYRSAGPNLEEILQQVVDEDEEPRAKPTGKYTKSSQVFASPSPLTPAELSTPVKDPLESFASWLRPHTPSNSSPPGNVPPFIPTQPSPRGKYGRFTSGGSPYGRTPKSVTSDVYTPHAYNKRGMVPPHVDPMDPMVSADGRKLVAMIPMDDVPSQDLIAGGHYLDWSNPVGSKYPPQGPMMNGYNTVTADSLRGKVYETAKDQHGCRFLQRWLDTNYDEEAVQVIMNEIIPHVAELMTDQYANFLVQKLFDIMPEDVRYSVARVAAPNISKIALTPHGTFSVQKMIETISSRPEMEIVREALSKDVVRLVKDAHGNHVIQKVLQRFEYADKEFIYEAVAEDCVAIAKNKQGCCVMQRCLEFASPVQKKKLVSQILGCCLQIVQDPFGNYVLQYVLEAHDSSINDSIAVSFLPHFVHLCMNKFSSNVMEKVLRGASSRVQQMYVDTMCEEAVASRLIQDDFGNYVLQTALSISTPQQADALVAVIRPLMPLIKNAPYAKKLEGKMDAICRKNGGFRSTNEYDTISRPLHNGTPKYERVGGYGHHRFPAEPRPTSWQTS